jgi:hypothetical protein
VSEALAQRADTLRVDVPRDVWRRGKRPIRGLFFRATLAFTFALAGLIAMPTLQLQIALIAVGVIVFALLPMLTDSQLSSIENEVQWADRAQAKKLLDTLEQRRLVALFAPFAWVQLQKGRLHLRLGDGRGAARAFAEAARLCGQLEQPALLGAQAHGLTLSGDRKEAHALLKTLEKRNALTPYDRLHLGITLIEEGRPKQAAEHLEQAAEVLDRHPRALAALALVLAKTERLEEAAEVFDRAEAIEELDADALAPDLLKRARKALRGVEVGKGTRRTADAAPDPSTAKAKPKKGNEKRRKKDKRKERRERRKGRGKDANADEHEVLETRSPTPKEPSDETSEQAEREEIEREKIEREKIERETAEREQAEREKAEREKAEREKAEREKAEREKAEREKAEREKAEREKAERDAAPKPPPVLFEGDKPVFRPPSIPPPPVLQSKPSRSAASPPKITVPTPTSKPAPAPTPAATDDDWGDVFGDDGGPVLPAAGKKDEG